MTLLIEEIKIHPSESHFIPQLASTRFTRVSKILLFIVICDYNYITLLNMYSLHISINVQNIQCQLEG